MSCIQIGNRLESSMTLYFLRETLLGLPCILPPDADCCIVCLNSGCRKRFVTETLASRLVKSFTLGRLCPDYGKDHKVPGGRELGVALPGTPPGDCRMSCTAHIAPALQAAACQPWLWLFLR